MNDGRAIEREAAGVLHRILHGELGLSGDSKCGEAAKDWGADVVVRLDARCRLAVQVKSRITPQTALHVCLQIKRAAAGMVPVIYAPVISPRVAEIARREGVGYFDRAGNCRIVSREHRLLIERQGFASERQPTAAAADPFSTRSSRIVRAMLSRPNTGWQIRQLAEHPDVQVSVGLVVKVKKALLEEGFALERDRRLFLSDPVGLLSAWAAKYQGPVEQVPLYFRGDAQAAERVVARWCEQNAFRFALAGFSAAWLIAPEVRYHIGAVYVENRGLEKQHLEGLALDHGGKRVDSGANIILWRPYDVSVFTADADVDPALPPATSSLQTYLDLKRAAGRGDEAAQAIYERTLKATLEPITERARKRANAV